MATEMRVQWGVLLVASTCLLLSALFVGWRAATPSECVRVTPVAAGWDERGVRPEAMPGCPTPPPPISLIRAASREPARTQPNRPGAPDHGSVRFDTIGGSLVLPLQPTPPQMIAKLGQAAPTIAFVVALFGLGCHAFVLRPRDPGAGATLLLGSALLASTVVTEFGLPPSAAFEGWPRIVYLIETTFVFCLAWGASLLGALHFPTASRPALNGTIRRWSVMLAPVAAALLGCVLAALVRGSATGFVRIVVLVQAGVTIAVLLANFVVVGIRVRDYRGPDADPVGRQQLLWTGASFAVAALLVIAFWFAPRLFTGDSLLPAEWIGLPGLVFVVGFGIAMLRYRLFGLDVVLTTALVYAALTATAVILYLTLTGLVTALVRGRVPDWATTTTAVLTAVALIPVRGRLQRGINRLIYGDRDDPQAALTRVAEQLGAQDRDLAAVAEQIRRALRLPFVAIEGDSGFRAEAGRADGAAAALPLTHPAGATGRLVVGRRGGADALSPREVSLLQGWAHQIGLVLHEVELTAELRASRERIVVAREEERRALRRTLHDELGPAVSALALRIQTTRALARQRGSLDPDTDRALADTSRQASAAADQLRQLSYDLRPPVLDELGLWAAIRDYGLGAAPLTVTVESEGLTDKHVARLPAAVEVAAYRIITTALANVVRHAAASRADVRIERTPDLLRLCVRDDGSGIPDGFRRGVGVTTMSERAAELGGLLTVSRVEPHGTVVEAELPLAGRQGTILAGSHGNDLAGQP